MCSWRFQNTDDIVLCSQMDYKNILEGTRPFFQRLPSPRESGQANSNTPGNNLRDSPFQPQHHNNLLGHYANYQRQLNSPNPQSAPVVNNTTNINNKNISQSLPQHGAPIQSSSQVHIENYFHHVSLNMRLKVLGFFMIHHLERFFFAPGYIESHGTIFSLLTNVFLYYFRTGDFAP